MKKIFLLFFLSIYFSNSSYNGLLFPKNTFELLTNNSNYSFYQDIILSTQKNDLASTSYLNYPNSISANYISYDCLLYTSPSPRDRTRSRMPSSA